MAEKPRDSSVADKSRRPESRYGSEEPQPVQRARLVSGQTEDDHTSTSCLESALKEHQSFTSRVSELHGKTSTLLSKIQTRLGIGDDKVEISFPIAELKEVESALKKNPAVIFIGNRNCGKSSLLNELLGGTYLPVHENPCTSRIVRIKYSEKNVARVVSPDGRVLQTKGGFKKAIPKDFVVLADKEKDDKEKLETLVEVGLNHELLRSGIELIDCPGKNETPALDGVVDEFLEKGTAPLVVYVIDGDMHLRQTDHETIIFLQDKLPHVSFIYVCNKIDTTEEAKDFDNQDSDSEHDFEDAAAAPHQAPDKKEAVFTHLLRLYLLPEDADIDSCEVFHGLSARDIRSARLDEREDEATKGFSRFRECFLVVLAEGIKRQVRLAIDGIGSVLDQFILAIRKPIDDLPKAFETLNKVIDVARKTEESIAHILRDQISGNLVNEEMVAATLSKVKRETVQDAETYQKELHVVPIEHVEELIAGLPIGKMNRAELQDKVVFIFDIATAVAGKVAAILGLVLDKALESVIIACTNDLQQAIENIEAPLVKRALCQAYGIDLSKANGEGSGAGKMARRCLVVPSEMLRSINGAVCSALSKETLTVSIKQLDAELVVPLIRIGRNVVDNKWKEKVVHSIISRFKPKEIAFLINETCKAKVSTMHSRFISSIKSILALHKVVESLAADQGILNDLRVLYFPQLMQLAVKARSLKNELDLGAVQLGELVASGKTTKIHSCSSSAWPENAVVRVVEETDVGEELWIRLTQDLYWSKELLEKQASPSPFLLRLYGWLMPAPDILHIVVETAGTDLLSALQQGMTLKERLNIGREVALGLKTIHDGGYVFGDLKPRSILISRLGTAKINLAKCTNPFQKTRLGIPFHLALDVYKHEDNFCASNDIYAFGMLLWVLCDGTGSARPKAYEDYVTKSQMSKAVQDGIIPERPKESSDACWELMKTCWKKCSEIKMDLVIEQLTAGL